MRLRALHALFPFMEVVLRKLLPVTIFGVFCPSSSGMIILTIYYLNLVFFWQYFIIAFAWSPNRCY